MTVCSCRVTYAFQSESTLYSCLNVKELLARSRRKIRSLSDWNWTRTQNHLVRKRTLNHLVKLTNGWVFVYELSCSGLESSQLQSLEENIARRKYRDQKKSHKILRDLHHIFFSRVLMYVNFSRFFLLRVFFFSLRQAIKKSKRFKTNVEVISVNLSATFTFTV